MAARSELPLVRDQNDLICDHRQYTDCEDLSSETGCSPTDGKVCPYRHIPNSESLGVCREWLNKGCFNVECPHAHPASLRKPGVFEKCTSDAPNSGRNVYEEMCKCVVCCKIMKDPKTLFCEHSFCKECLEELVEFKEDSTTFITCPTCKEECILGIGRTISFLKPQLILKELLNQIDKSTSRKFHIEAEKKLSPKCCDGSSEWYCRDCQVYSCNICINSHTLSCKDYHKIKYSERLESFALYCGKHDSFHTYGCLNCSTTFCSYCRQENHTKFNETCSILSITEYAYEIKNPLTEKILIMKNYNSKHESLLEKINLYSSNLQFEEENVKKYIKDKKMVLLSQILFMFELTEKQIMGNFHNELNEFEKAKHKLTSEIQSKMDSVQDVMKHSEDLTDRNFIEIICQTKDMLDRFYSIIPEEILEEESNLPEFKFQMHNKDEKTELSDALNDLVIAVQGAFGDIQVSTVDGCNYESIDKALNMKCDTVDYSPSMFTKLNDSTEAEKYVLKYLTDADFIKSKENKSGKSTTKKPAEKSKVNSDYVPLMDVKLDESKFVAGEMLADTDSNLSYDRYQSNNINTVTGQLIPMEKSRKILEQAFESCMDGNTQTLEPKKNHSSLNYLADEIKILIADQPSMQLRLTDVANEYNKYFQQPLVVSEYGFNKMIQLIQAMSDSIQILDYGNDNGKFICLSGYQPTSDALWSYMKTLLDKSASNTRSISQLCDLYEEKMLKVFPYDAGNIDEFLARAPTDVLVIGRGLHAVIIYQKSDNYPATLLVDQLVDILHKCFNFTASIQQLCKQLLVEKNICVSMDQINSVASANKEVLQVKENQLKLTPSASQLLLKHDMAILLSDYTLNTKLNLNKRILFNSLGDALKKRFNMKFSVSSYGKPKMQDLLDSMGTGFVTIAGEPERKVVLLGPVGKFYCRCMSLLDDHDGALLLNDFNSEYERIYQLQLDLKKYGFSKVEDLIRSFPGLMKIYGKKNLKIIVLKERLLHPVAPDNAGKEKTNATAMEQSGCNDATVFGTASAGYKTIAIYEDEYSSSIEIPCEPNGTLLLCNILSCFPDAIGLKYKTVTGSWKGVQLVEDNGNDFLLPPHNGWDENTYYVDYAQIPIESREDSPSLNELADEIKILIRNQPSMQLSLSALDLEYSNHFQHPLVISEYGFDEMIQLIKAMPDSIQILDGENENEKFICLPAGQQTDALWSDMKTLLAESRDNTGLVSQLCDLYKENMSKPFPYDSGKIDEFLVTAPADVVVIGKSSNAVISCQKSDNYPVTLLVHQLADILYNRESFKASMQQLSKQLLVERDIRVSTDDIKSVASVYKDLLKVKENKLELTNSAAQHLLKHDVAVLLGENLLKKKDAIKLNSFGDALSKRFKRVFSVSMYGPGRFQDLLDNMGSGFVEVLGHVSNEKVVTLGPLGNFYCRCIRLIKGCGGALLMDKFESEYERKYGKLEWYGFSKVEDLIKGFPGLIKIYGEKDMAAVVLKERLLRPPTSGRGNESRTLPPSVRRNTQQKDGEHCRYGSEQMRPRRGNSNQHISSAYSEQDISSMIVNIPIHDIYGTDVYDDEFPRLGKH